MHRKHRRTICNCRFGRGIPISNNCALGAQHIKLWFARSRQVGINECCLRSRIKRDGDLCMVCISCMHPNTFVVLPADVSNRVGNDRKNLINKVTAPIKNCAARNLGIGMPIGTWLAVSANKAVVLKHIANYALTNEARHGDKVGVVTTVLIHHKKQVLFSSECHKFVTLFGSKRHWLFQHHMNVALQSFLCPCVMTIWWR